MQIVLSIENKKSIEDFGIEPTMTQEELKILLEDIHNFYYGRIPNLERVLCLFPDFLKKFYDTQYCIMIDEGALPLDWRFYLGIMVIYK